MNNRFANQTFRAMLYATFIGMVVVALVAPSPVFAQGWRCTTVVRPSNDDAGTPLKGYERCVLEDQNVDEPNPRTDSKPAPPAVRRALLPDANREERLLRERLHRAVRNQQRGKSGTSVECESLVSQIAEQQPLMRSLRADTRTQARERFNVLSSEFRERGC